MRCQRFVKLFVYLEEGLYSAAYTSQDDNCNWADIKM